MNIKKLLQQNAKRVKTLPEGFWVVTKPIHGFKKVKTYSINDARTLSYSPHADGENLGDQFYHHSKICNEVSEAAIVNLIIPIGETIYCTGTNTQARASKIDPCSIFRISDEQQVAYGRSLFYTDYYYANSLMMGTDMENVPDYFSEREVTCGPGLHFHFTLDDALNQFYI